jgi:hypothetical protein
MNLPRLADDALTRLVANCIFEVVTGGPRSDRALAVLDTAHPEIERRFSGQGETGLLAALGYHVGHCEPVEEERRHAILVYVFRSTLPGIHHDSHMTGWGEPSSATRLRHIEAMLRWFIDRHTGNPAMARACAQWKTDLDFVLNGGLKSYS